MAQPAGGLVSYAEYLAIERRTDIKHEYLDGVVRAMAGGTIEHARLASRFAQLLGPALAGRACEAFSADAKVRIEASNRSTYPDRSVVCGSLRRSEIDPEAITNPTVIVEVLSDKTEAYDRGEKFRHYRRLETLREYVLVAQDTKLVEVWQRVGDAWHPSEYGPGEQIRLESLNATLSVDALYASALSV